MSWVTAILAYGAAYSSTVLKATLVSYTLYLIILGIYNRFFHKLRHFPGPFWASITPLWYWSRVRWGKAEDVQYALHQKYGDLVRIAPDHLAVGDATAVETIFMPKDGKVWKKGEFYTSFDPHIPGSRTDSFSDRDTVKHAERRRIIAPLYTQGSVLQYEPCVDRLIDLFYTKMDHFSQTQETVDMSVWLKRYTFDVIGEIFYGLKQGFGMIRDDIDYKGWCHLMEVMPAVGASITYFPLGFRTIYMVSQLFWREGRTAVIGMFSVVKDAKHAVYDRWDLMQSGADYPKHDMLTNMLDIVRDRGEKVRFSVPDVHTEIWTMIWAGSDTTAIALTSIFYHLHKHPLKLRTLLAEIDKAFNEGRLTYPIRFNDARKLPFLHAVVMESMRFHGSLGTGLPREVPAEGAELCGQHIPAGCEVITNSCAIHFDERVFGNDAHEWRPERWLQDEATVSRMERLNIMFGQGPRMCYGRYITSIEMYKLLPAILRDFEFELLVEEWKVTRSWFHNQRDVLCKVSKRRPDLPRPNLVLQNMK